MQYIYKMEHDEDKITIQGEVEVYHFLEGGIVYYPTTRVITGKDLREMYNPANADPEYGVRLKFPNTGVDSLELMVRIFYP